MQASRPQPAVTATVRPPDARFARRVFAVFAALAIVSLGLAAAAKWSGALLASGGHTTATARHEIVIGNDVLAVPANAIRFAAARRDGEAERLDLYLDWPALEGYREPARAVFNHRDDGGALLFLTFEPRMMSRDMSGRLAPIYRHLIAPQAVDGPAGLAVHAFRPTAGYSDEVLVIGERAGRPAFVARCLTGAAGRESLAPCQRDLHVGRDLSLVYRFPAGLLRDWRSLDNAVEARARGFLREP